MNLRLQKAVLGLVTLVLSLNFFFCQRGYSQRKYKDPYDERVQEIAEAAAEYLKKDVPPGMDHRSINALAVLEYHKRYFGEIPEGIRLIDSAVANIAQMANEKSGRLLKNRETYFPAVAVILLAEYDAKKYRKQIEIVLQSIVDRQLDTGAFSYLGQKSNDTSQSQFAALAFYVARQHKIPLSPKVVEKLLRFYVDYQNADGSWNYRANLGGRVSTGTNSIHSASLSSVYLLADMLRLQRRVKKMSATSSVDAGLGLPKNVTVYVPPAPGSEQIEAAWGGGEGPVVSFDKSRLSRCKNAGDAWYESNFKLPIVKWNSYFMYALERYAWFKEQADGSVGGRLSTWYDQGVDYIIKHQEDNGAIRGKSLVPNMPVHVNTALSLLFLVRASQVISLPAFEGKQNGFEGLPSGTLTVDKKGRPVSSDAEKSLSELIAQLSDDNIDDRQLKQLTESMRRAIREFKESGEKSRGEVTAFLRSMIGDRNYYRRLVAIRFLSGQQDLDNVPALLYAMGDPNPKIAIAAHNGLRLISRKFDTFKFEDMGNREDNLLQLQRLKASWTQWYLEIRPDAELLE